MIRRTKSVVEATIPEKEELTVFIPLTEAQRFWYYRLLTRLEAGELEDIFGFNKGKGSGIKKEEDGATLPSHIVADNNSMFRLYLSSPKTYKEIFRMEKAYEPTHAAS
jgi:SNF2 family DNA or RNA helicase